ncbi:MAG: hypothetical protein ACOYL8_00800 [Patescibacteria group bacterium]
MKKSLVGPIIGGIAVLLVAAMFVYVFISLNRMDKGIIAVQQTTVDDAAKISSIVNFINSASNAQTK